MLDDTDIENFLSDVNPTTRALLIAMSQSEAWTCDNEASVVNEFKKFDKYSSELLSSLPDHDLDSSFMELLALFSTPRSLVILKELLGADVELLNRISVSVPSSDVDKIKKHTLFQRLVMLNKMQVTSELFEENRRKAVIKSLDKYLQGVKNND